MARAFKLPDLGEGIHEGEVLAVQVSVGDEVKEGDPILEVETDKAAVEIPSPYTGKVLEIRVKPGDTVKVGDVLMSFSGEGSEEEVPKPAAAEPAPAEAGEPAQPPAPPPETEEPEEPAAVPPEPAAPAAARHEGGPVPAAPSTRRLARELELDLRQVPGSGKGGLVTAEDVRNFAGGKPGAAPAAEAAAEPSAAAEPRPLQTPAAGFDLPPLPDFSKWGAVERIPLRSIRRATARQMTLAWSQIPHVHNQDWVDMTKLEAFRQKHKADIEAKGGKLTVTVFALKAVASALKTLPRFNATLDAQAGELVIKHYFHIGVAVNTEEGLIVPVIRDVDRKSIVELAVELNDLVQRTRERKVSLEELQGGSFTITNVGPMGGGFFAPIINYPQVAILGLGSARLEPAVVEKAANRFEVAPRLRMPAVLCIDHRALDGADAIQFLRLVIDALEDPDELLMTMI